MRSIFGVRAGTAAFAILAPFPLMPIANLRYWSSLARPNPTHTHQRSPDASAPLTH